MAARMRAVHCLSPSAGEADDKNMLQLAEECLLFEYDRLLGLV